MNRGATAFGGRAEIGERRRAEMLVPGRQSARGENGSVQSPPRAKLSIQIASPAIQLLSPHDSPLISHSIDARQSVPIPELKRFPFLGAKLSITEESVDNCSKRARVGKGRTESAKRERSVGKRRENGGKRGTDYMSLLFPRTNSILGVPLCPSLAKETRIHRPSYVKYFSPKGEKSRAKSPHRYEFSALPVNEMLLLISREGIRKRRYTRRSQSRVE